MSQAWICNECAIVLEKDYLFLQGRWNKGDCDRCGAVGVPRVAIDRGLLDHPGLEKVDVRRATEETRPEVVVPEDLQKDSAEGKIRDPDMS